MSDHERYAQVAQRKWAIMSESLIFRQKNKRFARKTDERIPSPELKWNEVKKFILLREMKWKQSNLCFTSKQKTNLSNPTALVPQTEGCDYCSPL